MKKLFALAVIFTLVLSSCLNTEKETTLTISNNSGIWISGIKWNGTEILGYNVLLDPGEKITKTVDDGTGYIYFYTYYANGPWDKDGRTQEVVIIEQGGSKTFVFTDSTIVIDTEFNMVCTLRELPYKYPTHR